jgi:hypothetical protein
VQRVNEKSVLFNFVFPVFVLSCFDFLVGYMCLKFGNFLFSGLCDLVED